MYIICMIYIHIYDLYIYMIHTHTHIYIYPLLIGPPILPHPARSPQSTQLSSLSKHRCPVHF